MQPVRTLDPETEIEIGIDQTTDDVPEDPRIRCPKCEWAPGKHDRWMCNCRHVWNTFDTGGVCPKCLYQWKITQCLACNQVSPHSDWYA